LRWAYTQYWCLKVQLNPKYQSKLLLKTQDINPNESPSRDIHSAKLKIILIIFCFLFALLDCSKRLTKYNYKNYKKLATPARLTKLQSIEFNKDKLNLYAPVNLAIVGRYLILLDSKSEEMLKIIELNTNKLLKSFGHKGQGPEEFISISQIIPDRKEKNSFWIYDIFTRNLKKFNIRSILNDDFYSEKVIRISSEKNGVPARLAFSSEDKIFGVGFFLKHRLSIYDTNGNFIKGIGQLPFITKDERFKTQHSQGYIGNFIIKEASGEIYIATRYGSIIEKYDMDGNLISTLYGPELFYPEYDIVPAGQTYTITYNKKTRFGYIDIQYNEKKNRLYLLYSGKYKLSQKNQEKTKANFGKIIFVLDDNDTVLEQLELDKEIFRMIVSEDDPLIFGLTGTELLIFPINNGPKNILDNKNFAYSRRW